jgi:ribosomal protein S18 acetylase RimI-like enzyme
MPQLREFRWRTDRDAVLGFQTEIYELNFPGFRITPNFLRDYEQQLKTATRHPGEHLIVLEDEQGIGGFIWIALITTMVEPFAGYIKNVYVAARLRGQGWGRQLLDAADLWFKGHGCTKVALDASVCNERAVQIYLAAGFEPMRYRMEKTYSAGTSTTDTGEQP